MTPGEKAVFLVNDARAARGVAPMEGSEENVSALAQAYADWLHVNGEFGLHLRLGR